LLVRRPCRRSSDEDGKVKKGNTKKTGSFHGRSNKLGHGGRAAQLKAMGVPGGVIGAIARAKGAAPGGPNYHGGLPRRSR
jgi:hypothetical protein